MNNLVLIILMLFPAYSLYAYEISDKGVEFVQVWEQLRLEAYQDVAGIWTIGYGDTQDVQKGQVTTEDQANKRLSRHLESVVSDVNRLVLVPLTQGQFDALVSLCYNIGIGAFSRSTLLAKLNWEDYTGAKREFTRWVYADGVRIKGLENRRAAEMGVWDENI